MVNHPSISGHIFFSTFISSESQILYSNSKKKKKSANTDWSTLQRLNDTILRW